MDIDLEGQSLVLVTGDRDFRNPTSPLIKYFIHAVNGLLNQLPPSFLLTAAPETACLQGGYQCVRGDLGFVHSRDSCAERQAHVHPHATLQHRIHARAGRQSLPTGNGGFSCCDGGYAHGGICRGCGRGKHRVSCTLARTGADWSAGDTECRRKRLHRPGNGAHSRRLPHAREIVRRAIPDCGSRRIQSLSRFDDLVSQLGCVRGQCVFQQPPGISGYSRLSNRGRIPLGSAGGIRAGTELPESLQCRHDIEVPNSGQSSRFDTDLRSARPGCGHLGERGTAGGNP